MSESLTVGVVVKSLVASRGGHEKYIKRLLLNLVDEGLLFEVFTQEWDEDIDDNKRIICNKIPVIRYPKSLRYWSFNRNARKFVKEKSETLDLVFTTGFAAFGDVYRAGGGIHKRHLENLDSKWEFWKPKNLMRMRIQKQLFTNSDIQHYVAPSDVTKKEMIQEFGINENRIKVIYNGIDTDRFNWEHNKKYRASQRKKLGLNQGDFVCLFAGGGWKRKGVPELLKGFQKTENPRIKLLLVGHLSEARLKRKIKKLNISERVQFHGYSDEIQKMYAAADLFVLPTKYDPGCNVILEALASGLPVVTTKNAGPSILLEGGRTGRVLDSANNVTKIANYIQEFENKDNFESNRKEAFETGQQYTMDENSRKILKTLKQTTESKLM